jgi:hypothetical protein
VHERRIFFWRDQKIFRAVLENCKFSTEFFSDRAQTCEGGHETANFGGLHANRLAQTNIYHAPEG